MNLDALWDCLTEGFEKPTKLIWRNIEDSKRKLGKNFVADVLDIFEEGKEYMNDCRVKFDYEIRG